MYGLGLWRGLVTTWRYLWRRPFTVDYPRERLRIHPRFRGSFTLEAAKCIACELCAKACPNEVILLEIERVENKRVLRHYDMDLGHCLFCGFCAEACPTGAISMNPAYELATYEKDDTWLRFIPKEEGVIDSLHAQKNLTTGARQVKRPSER